MKDLPAHGVAEPLGDLTSTLIPRSKHPFIKLGVEELGTGIQTDSLREGAHLGGWVGGRVDKRREKEEEGRVGGWVGGWVGGFTWALAVVVSAMKDMGFFLSSRRDWTTLVGSLWGERWVGGWVGGWVIDR